MEWQFIVALVVAIPIILFPAAFIWYVNIGGLYIMLKERRKKKAAAKESTGERVGDQTVVTGAVAQHRHEVMERTGAGR